MAYISGTIYVAQTNTYAGICILGHTCHCRKPIIVLYPQGGCNGLGYAVAIYGDRPLTCELCMYTCKCIGSGLNLDASVGNETR